MTLYWARLGALLVHRRSYVAPAAFGFGVGGLGLVGRWSVLEGFGVGGLRGSVVGCAFGFGVGGLGLVGRGLCCKVWGWLVGVGQW